MAAACKGSRYEEYVDQADPANFIGPMVTAAQQAKVQSYIQAGIDEGARLVVGGLGAPDGLERGNYVRPTVFAARKTGRPTR